MMKSLKSLMILMMSALFLFSCSDDDEMVGNTDGEATMSIRMVDAPGDYEAVYVDVEDVVIKYDSQAEVSLEGINTGVYDLLELTGGNSVTLFAGDVEDGKITQIRLVLGTENSVVVNGLTYDLKTPSAQQSGLKIQVQENLEAGFVYDFILDFDVKESIVAQGNGEYLLKPVIKASLDAETGSISGTVLPTGFQTLVTAVSADKDVIVTTHTANNGEYLLAGLPSGKYTLTFEPDANLGLEAIIIPDILVEANSVTEVEVVTFLL